MFLSCAIKALPLNWTLTLGQTLGDIAEVDIHIPDSQGEVAIHSPRTCCNNWLLAHLTLAH